MKIKELVCLAALLLSVSCVPGKEKSGGASGAARELNKKEGGFIIDSRGEAVGIPEKIRKAVVLNTNCYEMLIVLGVEDTVIGVSSTNKEAIQNGIADFGDWRNPNIEKIVASRPDIVFAYGSSTSQETIRQLENAGIALACLEFYIQSVIDREIIELGRLYRKEAAARRYLNALTHYKDIIAARTALIPEEKRMRVYYESYTNYKSVGPGTGGNEDIELAGCINVMAGSRQTYPEVSDEWILEQNPDLIVKTSSTTAGRLGRLVTDDRAARREYERLVSRTGWSGLDAVKNRRLLIISSDLDNSVTGILAIAKTAYPALFADLDPLAIDAEIQRAFFHNDAPQNGVLLYPPLE